MHPGAVEIRAQNQSVEDVQWRIRKHFILQLRRSIIAFENDAHWMLGCLDRLPRGVALNLNAGIFLKTFAILREKFNGTGAFPGGAAA
jgi:hypothetical protein